MTFPPSLYIGGGALLMGVLGGWTVRDWKADSDKLEAEERSIAQYKALTDELAAQSLSYEYLAQGLRAGERQGRDTIREVYRNVEVPASCAVPDAGVSVLNNALARTNAATAGQPVGELPDAP